MNKVLTKEQEGLFLLWATIRMNVKCSTEEEESLRSAMPYLKLNQILSWVPL